MDDDFEDEDDEIEAAVTVSTRADEAQRDERLAPHNEMVVRPRPLQELARAGGRMVSATHLAAALQEPADDAPAPGSRRWSVLNVVLFLLVLCSGAAAAVLYLKPQYREPTAKWVGSTWESVRTKLASMQWSSPPGESPAPQRTASKPAPQSTPAAAPAPAPAPQLASDQRKQPEPPPSQVAKSDPPKVEPKVEAKLEQKPDPKLAKVEASKEPPKTEPEREPAPATLPTAQSQLARDTTTTVPPTKPQQPQQQPQAQPNSSEPRSSEPRNAEARAPEPPSLEQAMEESRKLYAQAIDAEARSDYAAALQHYEQIKKLRRDAWPGGLQVRIDLAREALKSRSAKSE